MQETIKKIMEAEKEAAEIVSDAREKAGVLIAAADSELSDKLNKFRTKEIERFNKAVEQALSENNTVLETIKNNDEHVKIDLDAVSDEVLVRILNTVFD